MKTREEYIKAAKERKKKGDKTYWGGLPLLTIEELKAVPEGKKLICGLTGEVKIKGKDYIDDDTRGGRTAWAIDI